MRRFSEFIAMNKVYSTFIWIPVNMAYSDSNVTYVDIVLALILDDNHSPSLFTAYVFSTTSLRSSHVQTIKVHFHTIMWG